MLYTISRLFFILLFKILFRLKAFGRDNIPRSGGFIMASNHASILDPIILGVASPRKLHYIAKQELFKNKIFSWALTKVNAFPLKRGALSKDTIKKALDILNSCEPIAIFPEGTRSIDGSLQQPQLGVGLLSYMSKVLVVPAYIDGTNGILPKGAKIPRAKKVSVYFGKPMDIGKFDIEDKKEIYQKISNRIMESIGELKHSLVK